MESGLRISYRIDKTLVFMAPDDQVHEIGKHILGNIAGTGVCVVVLVKSQKIEPVVFLLVRAVEPYFVVSKSPVHALITNVAQSVQSHLRPSLLQQDGLDMNIVCLRYTTKIIDETGGLE